MKYYITLIIVFVFQLTILSQNSSTKSFVSSANEIEINVRALDEVKIQNSNSAEIEIHVFSQSEQLYDVIINEFESLLKLDFETSSFSDTVFRKYITKRINRASALIKIPKGKNITIIGDNVDVISESYKGDLNIFIEKGHVDLHKIQQDLSLKLYQGNVYFTSVASNLNITTNTGKIQLNKKSVSSPYHLKQKNFKKQIIISSIKANIFTHQL
ncbi:hypothetical protein [uncultured Tenacibaculum sp.]|uniref:hypothetical protein n=1 Tax=uncultured Tenacibaculum sp. TaxID=174713 RepID=UPI00261B71B1|nr:hypothetical protein [uncultured Tenacibaculum sp.]